MVRRCATSSPAYNSPTHPYACVDFQAFFSSTHYLSVKMKFCVIILSKAPPTHHSLFFHSDLNSPTHPYACVDFQAFFSSTHYLSVKMKFCVIILSKAPPTHHSLFFHSTHQS